MPLNCNGGATPSVHTHHKRLAKHARACCITSPSSSLPRKERSCELLQCRPVIDLQFAVKVNGPSMPGSVPKGAVNQLQQRLNRSDSVGMRCRNEVLVQTRLARKQGLSNRGRLWRILDLFDPGPRPARKHCHAKWVMRTCWVKDEIILRS
eukprot:scaffold177442_cov18-Tisochrysis_lutea.AAC.1